MAIIRLAPERISVTWDFCASIIAVFSLSRCSTPSSRAFLRDTKQQHHQLNGGVQFAGDFAQRGGVEVLCGFDQLDAARR
ncbi:hypothetical protein [Pseudomonas lundensis]|uniref:hypothetical protein n=1 Tax=Pseudomonas lundensis TaxID=86185 RepID=UPI002078C785|nr:hypothetical protein [Pseudomonas lundensis]